MVPCRSTGSAPNAGKRARLSRRARPECPWRRQRPIVRRRRKHGRRLVTRPQPSATKRPRRSRHPWQPSRGHPSVSARPTQPFVRRRCWSRRVIEHHKSRNALARPTDACNVCEARMVDGESCVGCGKPLPESDASVSLIRSKSGWRLTRLRDADGSPVGSEWRCPECWLAYKARAADALEGDVPSTEVTGVRPMASLPLPGRKPSSAWSWVTPWRKSGPER